jgi:hypothetical protein
MGLLSVFKNWYDTIAHSRLLQIGKGYGSVSGMQPYACNTTKRQKALLLLLSNPFSLNAVPKLPAYFSQILYPSAVRPQSKIHTSAHN